MISPHRHAPATALLLTPPSLAYMAWSAYRPNAEGPVFAFLGWVSLLWMLSLAVLPVGLVLDAGWRKAAMSRLAGLRESDERERQITGEAARATLLFALALQCALLIASLATYRFVRNEDGHGYLAVGLGYGRSPEPERAAATDIRGRLLPASSAPLLLALIAAQLAVFRSFTRKRYADLDA